jgi:hypothetical protein
VVAVAVAVGEMVAVAVAVGEMVAVAVTPTVAVGITVATAVVGVGTAGTIAGPQPVSTLMINTSEQNQRA